MEPKNPRILTNGKMRLRHCLELLRVKDPEKLARLVKKAAEEKWNISNLSNQVTWELQQEASERQKKRVEKKAEELRAQGKIVHTSFIINQ